VPKHRVEFVISTGVGNQVILQSSSQFEMFEACQDYVKMQTVGACALIETWRDLEILVQLLGNRVLGINLPPNRYRRASHCRQLKRAYHC
jgi:hypothetical protein